MRDSGTELFKSVAGFIATSAFWVVLIALGVWLAFRFL